MAKEADQSLPSTPAVNKDTFSQATGRIMSGSADLRVEGAVSSSFLHKEKLSRSFIIPRISAARAEPGSCTVSARTCGV